MKILKNAKENLFIILIILAYIALFIIRPDMGIASVENSGYYIKEMLMIMPVIFVLTALLDAWVPKEKITKISGERIKKRRESCFRLYWAVFPQDRYMRRFPFCVMLLKKGASIKNIVIILSSWAVIKVPMLLNEAKFLGMKFYGNSLAVNGRCNHGFFMDYGENSQKGRYSAKQWERCGTSNKRQSLHGLLVVCQELS